MPLSSVSIIVINFNGKHHLEACFRSLTQQNYSGPIEIIMVDNGSKDGSVEFVRERFPQITLLLNAQNTGFAPAVNLAARAATGDYLALLNNDAYAAPNWIAELVRVADAGKAEGVACVATRVLDWQGRRIDFTMGVMNFHGFGAQQFFNIPAERLEIGEEPMLFANGGAMLIDREVFFAIGCFDEDYFAYFEDVDLGWRLWVCGYKVVLNPKAVAYHRHHATASTMFPYQTRLLFERNALVTIIKNYDDAHLATTLAPALMLLFKRASFETGEMVKREDFDLRTRDGGERFPTVEVPKAALSCLLAVADIVDTLPQVFAKRAAVQAKRRRSDAEILPMFRTPLSANFSDYYPYLVSVEQMVKQFQIPEMFADTKRQNVLIMSSDPLRPELAGTGIRAVEMARVLSQHCHVTLAAYQAADVQLPGVRTVAFEYDDLDPVERLVASNDIILVQGFLVESFPFLNTTSRYVVVDMYDPFPLSNLEFGLVRPPEFGRNQQSIDMQVLGHLLGLGDFFICASEEQRNYWLGALTFARRLSPEVYREDRTLRNLIDLAPFGLPAEPPVKTRQVIKGVVPGIGENDTLLLWGGGIWEWFDPPTLLRAMAKLRDTRPEIKLFFLGKGHPNTRDVPEMEMSRRTYALAEELGLLGTSVFFNDTWVPYAERANYLLEADIGVSTHFASTETTFAFRTRLLDYFWAGLPMIVSSGDILADLVEAHGLGYVVAPEDVDGLASTIIKLADETERRERRASAMAAVRGRFTWEQVLEPLVRYCRNPYRAADALR
ncbi:MAG: glycosyltransferase, partial [Roseiflexaceae bacterium]|nr:glycosyltransferase [Roseiflexaceae bacterium]